MKDEPTADGLREKAWRGQLTDAERAATGPELQAELAQEARLNAALGRLPEVQVSSNFTARVLQAIDREEAAGRARGWRWSWPRLLPRVAVTIAVVAFAALSWQHYELRQRLVPIARSVAVVTDTSSVPGVEALDNYEAIQRMGQAQHADDTLLALMQ